MTRNQAVEDLKGFVLEHNLPRTDVALLGASCPYCGKSDRIRELESPVRLDRHLDATALTQYTKLWQMVTGPHERLGACKFCQNVLCLTPQHQAEPVYE
jgi:hypothetical protein